MGTVRGIAPGARLGAYEVVELIGAGGMGVVYKARDPRLDRLVAIKVLPPDLTRDAAAKQRFLLEAKAASALDHPNICTIHEIDEAPDGQLYLVMACYDGETLKQKIARGARCRFRRPSRSPRRSRRDSPRPTTAASSIATSSPRT